LGLVADVARHHDLPFVCIPVGTRNHFARDLGLNRSYPLIALAAFDGPELMIDLAVASAANGEQRTFLNNATFGAYADMVAEPTYREAKLGTAQKLVSEIANGERPPSPLHFVNPEGQAFDSAFLIMVAVGSYELATISNLGTRGALDDGTLQVTVLEPSDEPDLRRLTTAAMLGSLQNADGFWQWTASELEVTSPIGLINLGVDGESLQWESPVTIRVEPQVLRVKVPPEIEPVPGPQSQPLSATVSDLWKLATGDDADA
jgi:diacylglycerol kinase family enzyme